MIIKAGRGDLRKIADLFKIEYAKPPYNEKWTTGKLNKKVKDYFNERKIFVLKEENKLRGVIIFHDYTGDMGKQGFIDEIIVSSENQGKGYGKMLMLFAENYFKERGIKTLSLMSHTKAKAFNFYKNLGYKEHNFVSMEKKLL